MNRWKFS